jgi:hypothetical protein
MGYFNALIAVKGEHTHIDCNLALELERLLRPWMEGRFDWYAIGVDSLDFSAYYDDKNGFRNPWMDLGDDEEGWSSEEWQREFNEWLATPRPTCVLIPIRCHD